MMSLGMTGHVLVSCLTSFLWLCQPVFSQPCYPCQCSIQYYRQLNRWMSKADCANKGLTEFPKYLPNNVEGIDISYNKLDYESLQNLELYPDLLSLSLAHTQITSLPNYVFKNQTLLRNLDLSGNVLLGLHKETFNGLSSLRILLGLRVQYIRGNSFHGVHQLRELQLTLYQTIIPEDLFHGLEVKNLSLTLLSAQFIPQQFFQIANHSLQEVKLTGLKVREFPDNLFFGLVMLHGVNIETPNLSIIPDTSFKGSSNHINSLTSAPLNLASITLKGMQKVPSDLFKYQQSVETLKMSEIDEIPSDVFTHLPTLSSLDLSGCILNEVPILKKLGGLKTLNMSNTNLQKIEPDILSGLHSLQTLDLSFNNITYIPHNVFRDVGINLRYLDLSHNNVVSIHTLAFDNVFGLKALNLGHNQLKSLSNTQFWSLRNLQHIDLSHNLIQFLPKFLFAKHEDLISVNLSHNKLKEIPGRLLENTFALRFFDIAGNSIVYLPPGIMQAFDELSFEDNPIHCDCIIYAMLTRNQKSEIKGQCQTPVELNGTLLRSLNMSDLCVFYTSTELPTTTTKSAPTTTTTPAPTTTTAILTTPSTTQLQPTPQLPTYTTYSEFELFKKQEYSVSKTGNNQPSKVNMLQYPWFQSVLALSIIGLVIMALIGVRKFTHRAKRSGVYEVNACQ